MARENRTLPEKFALRLPEGWLAKLEAAGKENHRSVNSEVIARLETSFRGSAAASAPDDLEKRVNAVEKAVLTLMFGETGVGELDERISRLEKRLANNPKQV